VQDERGRATAGITLARELAPVPEVLVDRHKVLQILLNLISNARYAVRKDGDGGRIVLRLAREGGLIALTVEDSGCGIAVEDQTRIFGYGFTTKTDGHGFGLHSSANFAHEMGGSLSVASDGLGRGARFTLRLPVPGAAAAAA
jgi:signal transduction histidine kinase